MMIALTIIVTAINAIAIILAFCAHFPPDWLLIGNGIGFGAGLISSIALIERS